MNLIFISILHEINDDEFCSQLGSILRRTGGVFSRNIGKIPVNKFLSYQVDYKGTFINIIIFITTGATENATGNNLRSVACLVGQASHSNYVYHPLTSHLYI